MQNSRHFSQLPVTRISRLHRRQKHLQGVKLRTRSELIARSSMTVKHRRDERNGSISCVLLLGARYPVELYAITVLSVIDGSRNQESVRKWITRSNAVG